MYFEHLTEKLKLFKQILTETGYRELVIASGQIHIPFQDDMMYPFKVNPYFKEWLPLNKRPGCFLKISENSNMPQLYLLTVEDIWHTAPQQLPSGWEEAFDVINYESIEQLTKQLNLTTDTVAFLGESNELDLPASCCNPTKLCNQIDYFRRFKSPYEHACLREANKIAVIGHHAAYERFMSVGSERDILMAYLSACKSTENEMPYPVIAGLNEHAGVLHHFNLDANSPRQSNSFLIDAGVDFNGYASDITRSYTFDPACEFAQMIVLMDQKQREIIQQATIGVSNIDVHIFSHQKIAEVLADFKLINISASDAIECGLTTSFYPHGIGHGLGVNVHEKGGQLANPQGETIAAPEAYPRLRNTSDIVATQVHTIEPGLYFIPTLLNKLKARVEGKEVNWDRVEMFIPYGGIRIEDNIVVHKDGNLENLTRDAFAEFAA